MIVDDAAWWSPWRDWMEASRLCVLASVGSISRYRSAAVRALSRSVPPSQVDGDQVDVPPPVVREPRHQRFRAHEHAGPIAAHGRLQQAQLEFLAIGRPALVRPRLLKRLDSFAHVAESVGECPGSHAGLRQRDPGAGEGRIDGHRLLELLPGSRGVPPKQEIQAFLVVLVGVERRGRDVGDPQRPGRRRFRHPEPGPDAFRQPIHHRKQVVEPLPAFLQGCDDGPVLHSDQLGRDAHLIAELDEAARHHRAGAGPAGDVGGRRAVDRCGVRVPELFLDVEHPLRADNLEGAVAAQVGREKVHQRAIETGAFRLVVEPRHGHRRLAGCRRHRHPARPRVPEEQAGCRDDEDCCRSQRASAAPSGLRSAWTSCASPGRDAPSWAAPVRFCRARLGCRPRSGTSPPCPSRGISG